ncbi:MAG TPA: WD40 repeat domain-containing protein, partial [Fimbriimonadaceae bacterium]|nr:WD40 repeat domain-containing protein [Fimbriimonadaceae bacterium]
QELRRQRRAYSLGVVRTAAIGAAVIAIVGWLAWRNRQLLGLITAQRDQMAYDLYVANVNLMQKAWDEHNPVRLVDLLRRTEGSPYRGWEWNYWNRLANLDEYRLDYGAWVNAAPSPDDKLLAVTPPDATYVFDAPTGKLLKRIPLPNAASFLCWSPDSRTLLAGSTLHGINLIDTLTGTPRAVGPVEIPSVSLHAFDGQGKHFVMNEYPRNGGGLEAVVRRVDNLAVELRVRPPHGGYASWVEFSPDGTRLLGVERPGKSPVITERAFPGGNLLASYDFYQPDRGRGAEMPSFATTYSANGNDVFVGTTLGNVFAYHHGAKSPYRSLHVSDASITSLDRSADGRRLICETSDLLVQVFDISSSRLLATIAGAAVSPNRDGSELYLSDTSVRAVKVDGYREFDALTLPAQEELRGGAVLVGSDRIAAASQDILHVYDNAGRELGKLDHRNAKFEPGGTAVPAGERRAVKLSPNGMGLAAIHGDECILTPNGDLSAALTLHGAGSPDTVLMCKGGPYYVTAELGQQPVLWSARTGEKAPMQIHAPWPVVSCGLSRDGRLLAVSNQDGDLQVWDLVGRSSRLLAKPGPNASKAFAFSADDRYLVLCCVQDAKLYDLKTGRIVQVFPGNLNGLNSIDFSPDGSRMVTASSDNTARIWDPASGRELLRLGGFKNPVVNAQFTSDGQDIVTFEEEGSIRILHGGLMR